MNKEEVRQFSLSVINCQDDRERIKDSSHSLSLTVSMSKGGVRQFTKPSTGSSFLQGDKIQEVIKNLQGMKVKFKSKHGCKNSVFVCVLGHGQQCHLNLR